MIESYASLLLIGPFPHGPVGGLALTLILSVLGVGFAFPLSIAIALCRLSPYFLVQAPATALVYVVRGVPLLLLLFWSYFLVPVLIGHVVSAFTTLVVTLVIYQAAYMSEVVRAGIQALPKGQLEAARTLGMSYPKAMHLVILPQALFNMVPSLLNQFISTVKETSVGYVISVQELTFSAGQINADLLTKPFQVYLALSLIYFLVCYSLSQAVQLIERRVVARRSRLPSKPQRNLYDSVQPG